MDSCCCVWWHAYNAIVARMFVISMVCNCQNLAVFFSTERLLLNVFFILLNSDQMAKDQHNRNVAESQLSTQIIALLEHYKQTDPVGMPGNFVADPFPMPDSEQSLPMASTLTTTNALAYGLSKFRIKNIAFDLYHMMVSSEMFAHILKIL